MSEKILKKYLEADPRLERLLVLAQPHYDEANLPNHNMNHIAQVLYRALVILEQDKLATDTGVLIAATILHDIGYSVVRSKKGHEEAGRAVSEKLLEEAGFSEIERERIIRVFVTEARDGGSIEGDILHDADVLNMAGYGSMYYFFVSLYEYRGFPGSTGELYDLDKHIASRIKIAEDLEQKGMRTKTGTELLKNGFKERKDFLEKSLAGLKERPDLLLTLGDLL